jgi:outer membrane protein
LPQDAYLYQVYLLFTLPLQCQEFKMKSLLVIGVIGAAMLATGPAEARLKIGVVNMQRAVSETKEGQRAEARLTKKKKKLEAELNRKLKEFYDKEAKLRQAWKILKDKEKRKRAQASRKEFESLQKRYLMAERELMKLKTREMLKITKKLSRVVERIAKRDKYDYIFSNAAVLWAPRHVDLTNEVIRQFDKGK